MRQVFGALFALMFVCSACGDEGGTSAAPPAQEAPDVGLSEDGGQADTEEGLPEGTVVLEAEAQREGDPERGYEVLLGGDYVGCGIPDRLWDFIEPLGVLPTGEPAPESTSGLPYYLSRFETPQGVDVVGPNCLACHAGYMDDELVVGLGGLFFYYGELSQLVGALTDGVIGQAGDTLGLTEAELFELRKFAERMRAVAPYVKSDTAGIANPADNLAAILFAHRDRDTLAWSETPLMEPPPTHVIPVDTPPWWRMSKKNSMLYAGGGRGDHARIMMSASTLCIDDVETAREIDATMPDVRAFIRSIQPPRWPHSLDNAAADRGEEVFAGHCARCHGTYGQDETYPNLLIPVDEVGTDPAMALSSAQFAQRFIDWFNESFYGELSRLEHLEGYVAPPLDGIWATAPFLHNGSVPTLAALLDSSLRPKFWTWRYDSTDYDPEAVGWRHTVLEAGQDEAEPGQRQRIYDTTLLGYDNGGHTYGDALEAAQRADLLEYLKTL